MGDKSFDGLSPDDILFRSVSGNVEILWSDTWENQDKSKTIKRKRILSKDT